MPPSFERKQPPPPSLTLVFHPEQDREYVHFEATLTGKPSQPAVTALPFDVAAAGTFSFVNAWWLADAALLSYWDRDEAKKRFRAGAGLSAELIDNEGTQCYVAGNERFTIVSFRGTQPDELIDVL